MTMRYDKAPPEGWWPLSEQQNVQKRERRREFWTDVAIRVGFLAIVVAMYLIGYAVGRSS